VILDGEAVVLDEEGRPRFSELQKRVQLTRTIDIERASVIRPATLYVFDLIALDGFDLRKLPLRARKALLPEVLPKAGPLRYADHVEEHGEQLYEEVQRRGLEGIVAKQADSPYRGGRSSLWRKIKADRTGDFVIVGFAPPTKSGRSGFMALHLAAKEGEELVYVGRVGTGFSDEQLESIRAALEPLRRAQSAAVRLVAATTKNAVWVEPRLVCEVRYTQYSPDGQLRHPVFLRLREDKPPEACERDDRQRVPPPAQVENVIERRVPFSNLKKIFWPDEGYTKGDLIDYYKAVAPSLLPYLADRPVVLTRYPDGIKGKSFFQHNAPGFIPGWIRTERFWNEADKKEVDYFVLDDEESLLYVINLGTIPLHAWSSRAAQIQKPDWCILDLDPKGAPFAHVIELALRTRALCDELGLPAYAKTSGQAGLHVLIPLGGRCTHEQSRVLGQLIARVVEEGAPSIATTARALAARGGRVYLDYLQNGHGRTLVAPFSARPVAGAPVSTPLAWSEVQPGLDPARFTIRSAPERLARAGDPLAPILTDRPDLDTALGRLEARLRAAPAKD
jgi:bifunctional non-homologous end joining protein LigD